MMIRFQYNMKNVYTYRNTRIGREEFRCLTMLFRNLLVRFMRLKFHIKQTRREKLDNLRNHNNKINREGNVQISNAIEMMIYYMDNLQAQIVANWPSLKNDKGYEYYTNLYYIFNNHIHSMYYFGIKPLYIHSFATLKCAPQKYQLQLIHKRHEPTFNCNCEGLQDFIIDESPRQSKTIRHLSRSNSI